MVVLNAWWTDIPFFFKWLQLLPLISSYSYWGCEFFNSGNLHGHFMTNQGLIKIERLHSIANRYHYEGGLYAAREIEIIEL